MGFREGVAHVSFNVIAVQQVQPATQQGALAVSPTAYCIMQGVVSAIFLLKISEGKIGSVNPPVSEM